MNVGWRVAGSQWRRPARARPFETSCPELKFAPAAPLPAPPLPHLAPKKARLFLFFLFFLFSFSFHQHTCRRRGWQRWGRPWRRSAHLRARGDGQRRRHRQLAVPRDGHDARRSVTLVGGSSRTTTLPTLNGRQPHSWSPPRVHAHTTVWSTPPRTE